MGKNANLDKINFKKNISYTDVIEGALTINEVTKSIKEQGNFHYKRWQNYIILKIQHNISKL